MPRPKHSPGPGHAVLRPRWWPLALILLSTAAALVWIWTSLGQQRQDKVVATYLASSVALASVVLWLLALSRLRWRTRILGLVVLAAPIAAGMLTLERRGVTGDVVPVLGWRWSDRSAAPTPGEPPAAVERKLPSEAFEGDYPQFLGSHRDAVVPDVGLDSDWLNNPPRLLWRREVGPGWSGFAVDGPYAVTQEQRGAEEWVSCYHRTSGRLLWSHADVVRHEDPLGGPGPRATPTIHGQRVFALGATGTLNAIDLRSGVPVWSVNVLRDTGASAPVYGVSASPLVTDTEAVVVLAGGPAGHSLVAYDAASGERLWGGGDHRAAYSSPVRARLAGIEQYVVLNGSHLVGHALTDGRPLWRYPWPAGTENVSQPVVLPRDRVFASTGYGIGGKLFQVRATSTGELQADLLWESRALKAKFTNVVHRDGHLYGLDDGRLACVDVGSGERVWKAGRYGHGQVVLVGDRLLIQAESGAVALVQATPNGYRELGRFDALDGKTWNHPALAGRHLLVRNDHEAACFELPLNRARATPGRSSDAIEES